VRELQSALETAMSSFNGSIEDMRRLSSELNSELTTTREDIRRGVFELPEEARESAAALRQVVNEQVAALKELASLVSDEGNARDASSRQLQAASAAPAPAPAPARATAQYAQARTVTLEDQRIEQDIARSMEDVRQAVAPAIAPAPAQATAASTETDAPSGGWISDLLRRASSDDGKGGPLDAIRTRIETALDETAYAQQWDSYLAGNKASFSRRIFTLDGQQIFDDIRRQIGRDNELRTAAQDHLTNFEATLREMASRRASRSETRQLLMSDSGRLYTVLGQALGRFGG
jgi:hypothetical protein